MNKFSVCQVCQAPALYFNYGGLSCGSCKIFFRRNALKNLKIKECKSNSQCEINRINRSLCASCRLRKCFRIGMQLELIRPSRPKVIKPRLQIESLNLLQSDNSLLNFDQWTLLSNLTYVYDERKLISIAQQFMKQTSADSSLPITFFLSTYEITGYYLQTNRHLSILSTENRSNFLRVCADNVTCLGTAFSWYWSQLYNYKPFIDIFKYFYGNEPIYDIQNVLKYIDSDIIVAKLTISIFAFSNTLSICSQTKSNSFLNTLTIFSIENIYVEILWKYLLYRYGYYHSIQRFINIIQTLLAASQILRNAQRIGKHLNDIDALIEQTEISLLINEFE